MELLSSTVASTADVSAETENVMLSPLASVTMTFTVPYLSSENAVSFTAEITGVFPTATVVNEALYAAIALFEASSTVAPMAT